jgi:hypothetical protein
LFRSYIKNKLIHSCGHEAAAAATASGMIFIQLKEFSSCGFFLSIIASIAHFPPLAFLMTMPIIFANKKSIFKSRGEYGSRLMYLLHRLLCHGLTKHGIIAVKRGIFCLHLRQRTGVRSSLKTKTVHN